MIFEYVTIRILGLLLFNFVFMGIVKYLNWMNEKTGDELYVALSVFFLMFGFVWNLGSLFIMFLFRYEIIKEIFQFSESEENVTTLVLIIVSLAVFLTTFMNVWLRYKDTKNLEVKQ